MDTKWKKWKVIISFTAFFLGLSMLLWDVIFVVQKTVFNKESWGTEIEEVFSGDYQNMQAFRWYISDSLESFLGMAVGSSMNVDWKSKEDQSSYGLESTYVYEYPSEDGYDYGAYGYAYAGELSDYYAEYQDGLEEIRQFEQSQKELENILEKDAEYYEKEELEEIREKYKSIIEEGEELKKNLLTPEEYEKKNKERIKKMHESRKKDKNLLYEITYDGKTLYSNADGKELDGPSQKLPEGYNFLLYFDGSKVNVLKDGAEVDVYGDGIYRESNDWYVPGYQNFEAGESIKKATVCMAAAKNPIPYLNDYNRNYFGKWRSGLYGINREMELYRKEIASLFPLTIGAIILLLAAFLLRRQVKTAKEGLGKISGKLWLEGKLFLLVLFFFLTFSSLNQEWRWYWKEGGYFFGMFFYDYLGNILQRPASLLVFFWICWFLANDLSHNKTFWKHSLTGKLYQAAEAASLQLPLQKRMLRYNLPVIIIEGILAVTAAAFFLLFLICGAEDYLGFWLVAAVFFLILVILILIEGKDAEKKKQLAGEIELLIAQIKSVHDGNLTKEMELLQDKDLAEAVKNLNDIQQGMNSAVTERVKSETMKVELVSNVSHDIKTPLTSIISYVDLLKQEEKLPDYVKEYIGILDRKSQRLKEMVQDVFEISKAASGQLPMKIEALDLGRLLEQTLADMAEKIEKSSMIFKIEIPEQPVMILGDGQRLYRVFQNLLQNAMKYSLEGSRIYVTLKTEDSFAETSIKNTSKYELSDTVDFTGRFTRGDESRTDGGSGLGLSIAKSFTEACGGTLTVETIADLFAVTVKFQVDK